MKFDLTPSNFSLTAPVGSKLRSRERMLVDRAARRLVGTKRPRLRPPSYMTVTTTRSPVSSLVRYVLTAAVYNRNKRPLCIAGSDAAEHANAAVAKP